MADKKVTVRLVMEGGKVAESELVGFGKKGAAALGELDRASAAVGKSTNGMRFMVQNSAYQVQDFFVQVAGGTSASRALSQQLPQLLGGMGLIGVLAGTAAAALIPLGAAFFGVKDDAEGLAQSLKALDAAMSQLRSADKDASRPITDLVGEYGKYAEQAARVLEVQRQIAEVQATSKLQETSRAITTLFGDFSAALNTTDSAVDATERLYALGDIASALGLDFQEVTPEILAVTDALAGLAAAKGPEAQAEAMGVLRDAIIAAAESGGELSDEAINVLNGLTDAQLAALALSQVDIASGISAGADEAARLAKNLAAAAAAQNYSAPDANGRVVDKAQLYENMGGRGLPADGTNYGIPPPPKVTRSGGGISDEQKQANDLRRDAIQLTSQLRTDTEKYADEQARVNAMLAAGYIDADTYQRALTMIGEKYGETGDAAKFFKDINKDLKESIIDFAATGVNSLDKVIDVIKRAAAEAIIFGTGPLGGFLNGTAGGGGGGGFLSGLISAIFGGPRARGGGVEPGKAYLVGESGPEPFIPSGRGTILPNSSLGQSSAPSITLSFSVDARGAQAGVAEQIDAKLRAIAPTIRDAAVAAVKRSMMKSKSFGNA